VTPVPSRHGKKDSGVLTPSAASRRASPKPPSRQSSPKPLSGGSRAGSPLAASPISAGPPTPSAMTGLEGPGATPTTTSTPPKSLIVKLHISPSGRKRLRDEEIQGTNTVKRIKFNLKSGGKSLSPSPPPDDSLITEDEIVNLIRGERLTIKQLLARLKGKLKRNDQNKDIVGGVLKRKTRMMEGFLVLKD